jgi:signal peptidase I
MRNGELVIKPQRGDTVVFRLPKDDTVDYIKRVVGLPGDRSTDIGWRLLKQYGLASP